MTQAETKPIYVLHGTDTFLRDSHRKEIVSAVIQDADPQLCVARFDSSSALADVLDELRTLPFLAPCRVVIVGDADEFVSAHRSALEDYLASPCATSTLVLAVSSWPKNTRLAKRVAQIGEVLDCTTPRRGNVSAWLKRAAGRRGKKITPDAVDLLCAWTGADLATLNSEIEKLALYADDRDTITMEDVASLVTSTAGPAAFDLTNAVTNADTRGALKALAGMLTIRGEEFRALGLIAWHLRRALQAQQAVQAGQSHYQAVRNLRMPAHQQGPFTEFLQRRTLQKLQTDFRQLIRADLGMKSGLDAKAALQELVVALCS